jgi:Hsp20/alpha crystallin family protein
MGPYRPAWLALLITRFMVTIVPGRGLITTTPADRAIHPADQRSATDEIEVEDGVLTVSGEHQEDRSDSDGGRDVRRECRFGAFSRSIELPSGVDAQAIKARTRDGVVEVIVPLPSGATTQKVEITPAPASEEG